MQETNAFLYAPRWVKVTTILMLLLALLVSIYFAQLFIGNKNQESHLLAALAIGQIAVSGLSIAIVVFFSQRSATVQALQAKTAKFLSAEMPEVLEAMDYHTSFGPEAECRVHVKSKYRAKGIFGSYWIEAGDARLKMRIVLNVRRLYFLVYFDDRDCASRPLEEVFSSVFTGATSAGFEYLVTCEARDFEDDLEYQVARFFVNLPGNHLLLDATERLYWMRELMLVTRAFLIEMNRLEDTGRSK